MRSILKSQRHSPAACGHVAQSRARESLEARHPRSQGAAFIVDQALKEKQTDEALNIPADRIEWMEELFKIANVIPNAVPVSELVDQSVHSDAAKLAAQNAK
jgi:hypothetical protein